MKHPGTRGMTLIELLMVMGLMALLLGTGLGVIASLDYGTYGATGLVRSSLRSANQWAMARQAPARVRLDIETGRIAAEGLAVVGTWHFEKEPPKGALGLDGELSGADFVAGGFLGKALELDSGVPDGSYIVPVHTDPAFDLQGGFQIQIMLLPTGAQGGTVLRLDRSVKIEVTRQRGLVVTVSTQRFDEETGKEVSAGDARLATPAGVLRADQWNRVLVTYDRTRFAALVAGVEVAFLLEEGEVLPVKGSMVLGGGQRPWSGLVDNLVISAVGAQDEVFLPLGVSFPKGTPGEILFRAGGGLDRFSHKQPVELEVEFEDGRREVVRVNMYGTVE
ncbi:MAG TPA: prepilin-type N-terminal cleavage/methylation domain-containing protein [Planctomycetes bacterium]|nr:prepilin-type N-terminal cleavage/methylation domain-containing protein [Planctomycetota bacterium]